MADYFYKRYTSKPQYSLDTLVVSGTFMGGGSKSLSGKLVYGPVGETSDVPGKQRNDLVNNLKCDPDTGLYCDTYSRYTGSLDKYETYLVIASATQAWLVHGDSSSSVAWVYGFADITPTYVADEFVKELIAADGTYPDDGYNADDGYYYVKDRLAIQFCVRAGGAWKMATTYVYMDGAWHEAQVHPRLDGAWLG